MSWHQNARMLPMRKAASGGAPLDQRDLTDSGAFNLIQNSRRVEEVIFYIERGSIPQLGIGTCLVHEHIRYVI